MKCQVKEVFIMNILHVWSVLGRFWEVIRHFSFVVTVILPAGKEHLVELRLFCRRLDSKDDNAKKTL